MKNINLKSYLPNEFKILKTYDKSDIKNYSWSEFTRHLLKNDSNLFQSLLKFLRVPWIHDWRACHHYLASLESCTQSVPSLTPLVAVVSRHLEGRTSLVTSQWTRSWQKEASHDSKTLMPSDDRRTSLLDYRGVHLDDWCHFQVDFRCRPSSCESLPWPFATTESVVLRTQDQSLAACSNYCPSFERRPSNYDLKEH